jgi:hypothetical protein
MDQKMSVEEAVTAGQLPMSVEEAVTAGQLPPLESLFPEGCHEACYVPHHGDFFWILLARWEKAPPRGFGAVNPGPSRKLAKLHIVKMVSETKEKQISVWNFDERTPPGDPRRGSVARWVDKPKAEKNTQDSWTGQRSYVFTVGKMQWEVSKFLLSNDKKVLGFVMADAKNRRHIVHMLQLNKIPDHLFMAYKMGAASLFS